MCWLCSLNSSVVNVQVGVHIADVSHFIRPGNALDKEAALRATTVYLVDKRIDMVPGELAYCIVFSIFPIVACLVYTINKNKSSPSIYLLLCCQVWALDLKS